MHEDLGSSPTPRPELPKRVTQQGRTFGRISVADEGNRPLSFQDRRSSATEVVQVEPERRSTGSRPRITRA
jgi:hypothetical protein